MKVGLNPVTSALFSRLAAPPARLKISEWAEREAYLPMEGNSEPGKYRCARMPWQRAMLDDPLDTTVTETAWMLASQVGKTLCIILIIEFFIAHMPAKILVVYPKLQDVMDWLRDKFIPATRDTPCLEGKLKEPRQRDSESRALNRKFPGGGLVGVGSISTSSLRRLSARVVIQDEIDDFETTPQGDSMALADKRAETFHNAVKLKSSTPTHTGTSRIAAKYEASDQQKFFVPCRFCGHLQHLKWMQVKFTFEREGREVRDTESAVYVCESCQAQWTDQHRLAAIYDPKADWRPTFHLKEGEAWRPPPAENYPKIRGRHLNGIYRVIGRKSAFKSYLHEFAEDFLGAKRGGRETLMVWVNTFLAEPYSDPAQEIEWHPLMQRSQAESYSAKELPLECALVLASIDVQADRVEIGVFAFGDEEELWWVENHVVFGDFDQPSVQQQVDDFLLKEYARADGMKLRIVACGIDAAHKTKAVYRFCQVRQARRVWAVRGSATAYAPLVTPSSKRHYGITLHMIGTDTAKDLIFDRLRLLDEGPRYIHFPKTFTETFFKQLCSEKLVETFERGVHKRQYVKTQARNEALDKLVYVLGVYDILKPSERWIRRQLAAPAAKEPKEYVLDPDKAMPEEKPEALPPKPKKKWPGGFDGHGGMFNPLGQ